MADGFVSKCTSISWLKNVLSHELLDSSDLSSIAIWNPHMLLAQLSLLDWLTEMIFALQLNLTQASGTSSVQDKEMTFFYFQYHWLDVSIAYNMVLQY